MEESQNPGQMLMLAFRGFEKPDDAFIKSMNQIRPAGATLFRSLNIQNPAQLKALTSGLQAAAAQMGLPRLLIGLDQEGGQLMAVGEATQLPGNMALGATGSEELAFRAGQVLGSELSAMGVNVDYAPCADVNTNPRNPVVGVRSFGEDPKNVAQLSAALVRGIQSQGVVATAKHFPGHGDTSTDSHLGMALASHSLEELRSIDLPPFKAAIEAGVKLVMTAHLGVPAIDSDPVLPATLSSRVLRGVLRGELGYQGVIISDAMDMRAIRQGDLLAEDAARAIGAGVDLLLGTTDPQDQMRLYRGVTRAIEDRRISSEELEASFRRVRALKEWLAQNQHQPPLEIVNGLEHRAIADRIAERSITLVKSSQGLIPLKIAADERIAVIVPKPLDLTPADTSSYTIPQLANAVREMHANTLDFTIPFAPERSDIDGLMSQLEGVKVVIIGTINAFSQPGQIALVKKMVETGRQVIVAALRLPYDLAAFPEVSTYLCTYSILEPSMRALAKVLFGQITASGRLPVSIPGM